MEAKNKNYEGMLKVKTLDCDQIKGNLYQTIIENGDIVITNSIGNQGSFIPNPDILSKKAITERHGQKIINCMYQNSTVHSFSKNSAKLHQYSFQLTVEQYSKYQDDPLNSQELENALVQQYKQQIEKKYQNQNFSFPLNQDWILFGVNFDIQYEDEWKTEWDIVKNLPEELQPISKYNLLSYLQTPIGGVSKPQIYMKVPGVWTGGHQENASLRSININLGPGMSEWITIPFKDVEKFRKNVLNKFKTDIFKFEQKWYAYSQELKKLGVQAYYHIQKPGDTFIVAPGTLHWVRQIGNLHSVQYSWNFMYNQIQDFEASIHRYNFNIQLGLIQIIPLKNIYFNYLLHEYPFNFSILQILLKEETFKNWILQALQQEQNIKKELQDLQVIQEKNNLNDIRQFCSVCQSKELFITYSQCSNQKCYQFWCNKQLKNEDESIIDSYYENQIVFCETCLIKHLKICHDKKSIQFYKLHQKQNLMQFLNEVYSFYIQCQFENDEFQKLDMWNKQERQFLLKEFNIKHLCYGQGHNLCVDAYLRQSIHSVQEKNIDLNINKVNEENQNKNLQAKKKNNNIESEKKLEFQEEIPLTNDENDLVIENQIPIKINVEENKLLNNKRKFKEIQEDFESVDQEKILEQIEKAQKYLDSYMMNI